MKAYGKSILRSITRSKTRFFAIFAIVALGAGFAAGVFSAAPQMRETVDSYLDQQNAMDIELLSTLGFSQNDVAAVHSTEGVEAVMPSWYEDAMSSIDAQDVALRIHALPEKGAQDTSADSMNRPVLIAGRWPQKADECVLGVKKVLRTLQIGGTVTVEEQEGREGLAVKQFHIVGFVQSPMYLSYTLGSTDIGNGQLSHYLYVLPQAFSSTPYSCLYVRVKGAAELNAFTQEYKDKVKPVYTALENVGKQRASLRRAEVLSAPQEELDRYRADYEAQEKSAQEQLSAAAKGLDDAEEQITENQQNLAESEKQAATEESAFNAAQKQFEDEKQSAESAFSALEEKLEEGQTELSAAQKKITEKEAQLDDTAGQIAKAKAQLAANNQSLSAAEDEARQSRAALDAMSGEIAKAKVELEALKKLGLGDSQTALNLSRKINDYTEKDQKLSAVEVQLKEESEDLNKAAQDLAAKEATLEQAQRDLNTAKEQLAVQQETFSENEKAYQQQKSAAEEKLAAAQAELSQKSSQLAAAKEQIAAGEKSLSSAEEKLKENKAQYAKSKQDADTRLADAQKKISNAQKKINSVALPVWYVLNRNKNVGLESFSEDANRMQSIARLFPVFFFLVAVLVVLTTMTRMVEEDRLEIGTYKALGFPKSRIMKKYLLYAIFVSLSGGIVGVTAGCMTLPSACWNAYRILYSGPPLSPRMNWFYATLGCLLAVAVAVISTFGSCSAILREKPAALLLPKAPEPGKRILLEHVKPVWNRMNFSSKVTARNLFRYKKRFYMTIAGIVGCTALMLTGFGLRDSVHHIVSYQFTDLYHYNMQVSLRSSGLSEGAKAVLNDKSRISKWMACSLRSTDFTKGGKTLTGYVVVPQSTVQLPDFVDLRSRMTHGKISSVKDSVIVTEKLASHLGLKTGSKITVPDGAGKNHEFTVTGITENYIYHYVYIAPEIYRSVTGRTETPNEVLAQESAVGSKRTALGSELLGQKGIATVAFLDDVTSMFDNVIHALDVIVLIFIFCAGMLSFVVLYNLTNININERAREMATLRVLGFTVQECEAYIYRETTVLTLIGCALGLVLGIFMHAAVVTTVEVDICMFPRDIAPLSYFWSILLTLGFTAAVDVIVRPKFRKINMVESLKSVD